MMISKFKIYKIVDGTASDDDLYRPYIILETYVCADGKRTRIVDGRYETKEKADRIVLNIISTWSK